MLQSSLPIPTSDPLPLGIHGEAAAIVHLLRASGIETSLPFVLGMTATCFRTHFFTLEANPGMVTGPKPTDRAAIWGPRYAWTSLRHNNYGLYESASYFFGGDVRLVPPLSWQDTWKLIRFEIDAERPLAVVSYPDLQPPRPAILHGYSLNPRPMTLCVHTAASSLPAAWTPKDGTPSDLELILVRPGPQRDYRPDDETCKRNALVWAAKHISTSRELVYETERFYTTGYHAIEAFQTFLLETIPLEHQDPVSSKTPEDAALDLARFTHSIASQWVQARTHAATFLNAWAAQNTPAQNALQTVASSSSQTASLLRPLLESLPNPWQHPAEATKAILDASWREQGASNVAAAASQERVTAQHLQDAVRVLQSA